ncbi:MAG: histidine triad nucleotide-binding protein [Candidatus Endonucleobacter bathymodioli]|uniref:Histidine triad nucleotide-binding protein n=1 Tax=Candidatus Endonucleibacter bathymodioli TaxID=539814 RepID=A0AA90NTN9_9GAMM|nr:histidine triad nucleotide-binding protein [Candidatus Endonucleobacter bathymodioli]
MNCLFCKMVEGEIPTDKVFEDDDVLAFKDINPAAPSHVLIIPKKHISTLNNVAPDEQMLMGKIMLTACRLASELGIADDGYRVVMNCNSQGGQSVYHIHLHLLGGRQLQWPPG